MITNITKTQGTKLVEIDQLEVTFPGVSAIQHLAWHFITRAAFAIR